MPQVDLKYSESISLDAKKLFQAIESVIRGCDESAGACKSRAYPAKVFLHEHVLLSIALLKMPHRDGVFLQNMQKKIEATLVSFLPNDCHYAINLSFLGVNYLTSRTGI